MKYFSLLPVLLALASCTHSRDNPCDVEGNVFDPNIYGEEVRQELFEMGWVQNIDAQNCGSLIDRFEVSRHDATADIGGQDNTSSPRSLPGYMPWTCVTFDDAKKACAGSDPNNPYKRICKKSEFILACKGGYVSELDPSDTDNKEKTYPYGNDYQPKTCNGKDKGIAPTPGCYKDNGTGQVLPTWEDPDCYTDQGVIFATDIKAPGLYDLTGNVMEWVEDDSGNGVAIGGSYLSGKNGMACDSIDTSKDPKGPATKDKVCQCLGYADGYIDVGFRCCK